MQLNYNNPNILPYTIIRSGALKQLLDGTIDVLLEIQIPKSSGAVGDIEILELKGNLTGTFIIKGDK